jgi:sorting nexin-1/2
LRRYSDFLWLYETLSINNPGVIVPPVPEKQQYGRFQDTFVENRRAALNKCIQKIVNHPSLRDDPDLKLFLESDSFVLDVSYSSRMLWAPFEYWLQIKHRKAEIAHERGGLMASIGSSLVGPRFYETDEV